MPPTHTKRTSTISVVLMVKNEKPQLREFFENVTGVADEVVLVDTGSVDGTVDEAESIIKKLPFPVRILSYVQPKFHDGQTRQYAVEQCTQEYVLQIDADERMSEEFKTHIKEFLANENPIVATIPRIDDMVPHLHDVMNNRLFKRESDAHYSTDATPEAAVHAQFVYSGTRIIFPYPIYHMQGANHWLRRPHRIFDQLTREIDKMPNTRGLFRELVRGTLGFFYKFRNIYFRSGVREDGRAGLKFAFLKGLYVFLMHLFVGLKPRVPKE